MPAWAGSSSRSGLPLLAGARAAVTEPLSPGSRASGYSSFHGFAKRKKDNISQREKTALTRLAEVYMAYDDATLADILADGDLLEIMA